MIFKKYFKQDETKNWIFKCEYLPTGSVMGDKLEGNLVLERNWKKSHFYFEPKQNGKKILFPMNYVKCEPKEEVTKKFKMNYKNKLLKIQYIVGNKITNDVFNIPSRKFEAVWYYISKFFYEYEHDGHIFEITTKGSNKKILFDLFNPSVQISVDEQLLNNEVPTKDRHVDILITNFRIYSYNKKYKEVINPIPFPVDCHSENVKKEVITKSTGGSYGNSDSIFGQSHNMTTKKTSKTVGDVVIFDDQSREHVRIHTFNPEDIVKRIQIANKRFIKKESFITNVTYNFNGQNISNINTGNITNSNFQQGNNNSINQTNVVLNNKIKSIVDSLKSVQKVAGLDPSVNQKLSETIMDIETQMKHSNPNYGTIKNKLSYISNGLITGASSAFFRGIFERIIQILPELGP